MSSRLLVTGATGMIGSLLTDALVDRGTEFSVMLRPGTPGDRFADMPGVTVIAGDFDDRDSLERALEGVDRAFLLTNSTDRSEVQQAAFVDAATSQGVRHVVKLSQLAADAASPVRFLRYHAKVEAALMRSDIEWTFVRPNLILQAYLPFAQSIAHGMLQAPIGTARVSAVDARDIASVSAAALTQDDHAGKVYTVTGPDSVSHSEIAATIGAVIGRTVEFQTVDPRAFVETLTGFGMPQWQAEGLAEDYAHYDRGEAAAVSDDVERVTADGPRSVADFARDYALALASA